MACRAVTFDFNGTLSDDEEILFGVYAALFAEHGRPLARDEYYARLAGLSEHEIVRAWLGERDDLDAIVRERIDRYRAAVTDGTTVPETMRAAVRFAAGRVPVAVVSGATRAEIEPVVAAAGIAGCFRAIVDDSDVAHGKPHPESSQLAVSSLARQVWSRPRSSPSRTPRPASPPPRRPASAASRSPGRSRRSACGWRTRSSRRSTSRCSAVCSAEPPVKHRGLSPVFHARAGREAPFSRRCPAGAPRGRPGRRPRPRRTRAGPG
jgi:beta-phosphoglucomutase-like phosphatase (HAD superfamily)